MGETTGVAAMIQLMTQLISAITTALTSLTTWILGNELALFFFAIMLIMLVIHVLHSLVHKFS